MEPRKYWTRRQKRTGSERLRDFAFGMAYGVGIIALWCIGLILIMGTYAVYLKLF